MSKILIVDDNEEVLETLGDILQELGYQVVKARTGQEGIDRATEENPDLVLLDTRMPDMNGIDVCRQLKQEKNISAKVIVYTALIDAFDAQRARESGADGYCLKGTDASNLLATIKNLLN